MRVELFLKLRLEFSTVGAFDPEGIARNQGLTEDDQLAAPGCAFGDPVDDLRQSRIALEPDRSDLAQRDGECLT